MALVCTEILIHFVLLIHIINAQFFAQRTHLTPLTLLPSELSGISVIPGQGTTINNKANQWDVEVITQFGSDLEIHFDGIWGFHPNKPSTFHITINGITPNKTLQDGGIIIVFSSNNQKYFTTGIHLDTQRSPFQIFPADLQPLQTSIGRVTDIISLSTPERWNRFSSNNSWYTPLPPFISPARWPMYFTVTNDPIFDTLKFQWRDGVSNKSMVNVMYSSSFQGGNGFDFYIAGDAIDRKFTISSIGVQYTIQPTPAPTTAPTIPPTMNPTVNPSMETRNPSMTPTMDPTIFPTGLPTVTPSLIPSTANPTNQPSKSPTYMPMLYPSLIPTKSPSTFAPTTFVPTTNGPSEIPTIFPTVLPTDQPSYMPTIIPTAFPTVVPSVVPTDLPSMNPTLSDDIHIADTYLTPNPYSLFK